MIFNKIRLIVFASLSSVLPMQALVYKIVTWQHPESGQNVHIFYHFTGEYLGSLNQTQQQQRDLIDAAHAMQAQVLQDSIFEYMGNEQGVLNYITALRAAADKPSGIFFKFLDTLPQEDFNYASITAWQQGNNAFIFDGLDTALQAAHVSHLNVECRHLIFASCLGHPVTVAQLQEESAALIGMINSYDDGQACNKFYQEKIKRFEQVNADILQDQEVAIALDDQLSLAQSAQRCPLTRLVHYGEDLAHAKIVHELIAAQDHKDIFLILAGEDAQVINSAMPRFGYQRVHSVGHDYWASGNTVAYHPLDIAAACASISNGQEYTPTIPTQPTWYGRILTYLQQLIPTLR